NLQTRYPVLYLFHGANADEAAWTRLGHVNLILDNLLAAGKTKPFLVVMPFGYGVPPGTAPPAGVGPSDNTTLFSRDLIEDVIPFVQSVYREQHPRPACHSRPFHGRRPIAGYRPEPPRSLQLRGGLQC